MNHPIILLILTCCTHVLAAQTRYAAENIPSALRKNADVVIRHYELKLEVLHLGEAIETEHKAITLLNGAAATSSDQYFDYSSLKKIESLEGAVYDANGKLVRKIKKGDIDDFKPFEYFVNDGREKVIHFPHLPYPYTIEYTVVTRHKGIMHYPAFMPQESASESVEFASLELVMHDGLVARTKEVNLPENCKKAANRWEFSLLPAITPERYAPGQEFVYPLVLCSPADFTLEGFEGNMSSWAAFGTFIAKLNEGKDVLPAETVTKLRQLTGDCPDNACKVERIYHYLQENTRYFYVGMGIGGWQPMAASDVDKFKYSDCKGLSNYTAAMLRTVGVPAYYALISAGKENQNWQFPDFPNAWFNHAIVCVPLDNDTIWLECTSQRESCGFASDFTDNRLALLITPVGGKIVKTPEYDENDNTIYRQTTVKLAPDGSAQIHSGNVFKCIAQNIFTNQESWHNDAWKKYFYEHLNLSNFEISSLDIRQKKGRRPEALQTLELTAPGFAAVSGKRLFVPLVALSEKINLPPDAGDRPRQRAVQADARGYTEDDDIQIAIPDGYQLENEPVTVNYQTIFGRYELSVKSEKGRILVHRTLVMNHSVQPKEQYNEFVGFLRNISKADKTKLVLVKEAAPGTGFGKN